MKYEEIIKKIDFADECNREVAGNFERTMTITMQEAWLFKSLLEKQRKEMIVEKLIKEIEKYGGKYQISFQFWGDGNNNVFIMKNDIDLYSSGGFLSIQGAIMDALQYIYKINRVPYKDRAC
jgi:hypothetical protein